MPTTRPLATLLLTAAYLSREAALAWSYDADAARGRDDAEAVRMIEARRRWALDTAEQLDGLVLDVRIADELAAVRDQLLQLVAVADRMHRLNLPADPMLSDFRAPNRSVVSRPRGWSRVG